MSEHVTAAAAFPADVLPAPVQALITRGAESLPSPLDLVGVPVLAVLAAAIGNSRELEVKPGWTEGARLFAALVAAPGTKKTPALQLAITPLKRRQAALQKQFAADSRAHEEGLHRWESAHDAWRQAVRHTEEGADPGEMPERPAPPVRRQLFTTDATIEALAALFQENERGIICIRDELVGWVRGMNQYRNGRGADRQDWLSLWSGSSIVINRKGAPAPLFIERPVISVVGCLPPEALVELRADARDDGFLDRVLFSLPEHEVPRWSDAVLESDVVDDCCAIHDSISELSPHENGEPRRLRFDAEAKSHWLEWLSGHYAEIARVSTLLRGPWAEDRGLLGAAIAHSPCDAGRRGRGER